MGRTNTTISLDPTIKDKSMVILQNKMNTSLSAWINMKLTELVNSFSKSKLNKEVKNGIVKG